MCLICSMIWALPALVEPDGLSCARLVIGRPIIRGIPHYAWRLIAGDDLWSSAGAHTHESRQKRRWVSISSAAHSKHLALQVNSANPEKPKTSGGTLGSLENRRWPVNEPCKILDFSGNGFTLGIWRLFWKRFFLSCLTTNEVRLSNKTLYALGICYLACNSANNLCGLEPQLIKLEFIIYLPKLKVEQLGDKNGPCWV